MNNLGKTTLMNVLSGQYSDYLLMPSGDVLVNGIPLTGSQRQTFSPIGYVEQEDCFIDTLTLREHLIFQVEETNQTFTFLCFSRLCFEWLMLEMMKNVINV